MTPAFALHQTSPQPSIRQIVIIDTKHGPAQFVTFAHLADDKEHIALVYGDLPHLESPLVRVHSECLTGDVFASARCDCGEQLNEAQEEISKQGGVILYLRQEGRGIGLYNKIDAYALQDLGHDTFQANQMIGLPEDSRNYLVAAQMLQALDVSAARLLTNNPDKVEQLRGHGVDITAAQPTALHLKSQNRGYLLAKVLKGGHSLNIQKIMQAETL
ncbi:MAG: GTP cyclohydrolase II [Proteobacteria bacterium]|nr:MAG: GTP cyclohydrolase II [Pseudomonadota bacterium]